MKFIEELKWWDKDLLYSFCFLSLEHFSLAGAYKEFVKRGVSKFVKGGERIPDVDAQKLSLPYLAFKRGSWGQIGPCLDPHLFSVSLDDHC